LTDELSNFENLILYTANIMNLDEIIKKLLCKVLSITIGLCRKKSDILNLATMSLFLVGVKYD